MSINTLFRLMVISLLLVAAAPAEATKEQRQWNFTVYLDDTEIGYHRFRLLDSGTRRELTSEARFDVKILFFNAYSYEHEARERWHGDCVREIEARTDDNGTSYDVRGTREGLRFVVRSDGKRMPLPECVMTFAYWNPEFRTQARLLNPQDGEYVDVSIEPAGPDRIDVRGEPVDASRYVLRAEDLEITLWYSRDDQWLALDSVTDSGRRLRYRIE
jgi:hypothetical protein